MSSSPLVPAGAGTDLGALRDLAVALAREVGAMLVDDRPADLGVTTKSTQTDLVTVMDERAEKLIVERLAAARPDDGVHGEEGNSTVGSSGIRWIVDPLDGTVNYAYGRPDFAVSIAAVEAAVFSVAGGADPLSAGGSDPVAGVLAGAVFDGRTGRVFHAARGGGAFDEDRALRCTGADDLATALIGTGFSYEASVRGRQGRLMARLLPQIANIRRTGSAALDMCSIADGSLDGFAETDLSPWDWAAGGLIALEAGARARAVTVHAEGVIDDYLVVSAPGIVESLAAALGG